MMRMASDGFPYDTEEPKKKPDDEDVEEPEPEDKPVDAEENDEDDKFEIGGEGGCCGDGSCGTDDAEEDD